jgi:hypothetical protein
LTSPHDPIISNRWRPPQANFNIHCERHLLDRLTHHAHILELNGESYRLKQSKARRRKTAQPAIEIANSDTAEDADS